MGRELDLSSVNNNYILYERGYARESLLIFIQMNEFTS